MYLTRVAGDLFVVWSSGVCIWLNSWPVGICMENIANADITVKKNVLKVSLTIILINLEKQLKYATYILSF